MRKANQGYVFFVKNCFFENYQANSGILHVDLMFVNNTNKALNYISSDCLCSKFYKVDNANMIIQDDECKGNNLTHLIILPHKAFEEEIRFKFHQKPTTAFSFKIGMKIIPWRDSYAEKAISYKTIQQAKLFWSETKVLKLDKKHEIIEPTYEEDKKLRLKEPIPVYYALTKEDRKNYTLSIDQHKITKSYTTLRYAANDEHTVVSIPSKFTNNSNDTLRYMSMSCSWWDFYQITIKGTDFWSNSDCTKNIPQKIMVPPHTSLITLVQIIYKKGSIATGTKFKIGMSLQKFVSWKQPYDADTYLLRPETSNLIWSNEVKIP
jgi:hypothetical protein